MKIYRCFRFDESHVSKSETDDGAKQKDIPTPMQMVEGHIFTERWNDKNTGEERFQKVIQATSLRILGKSKKFEQGPEVGEPANTPVE